ncbi:WD40/YVTN/BNR-like repeat-containing protein [Amycolatopsis nigrescens]|uniref:WD40/YVTN/BNR-like repeat-containing protein n=1 Tax=Amycolatopsis nigrescens TaxID=381445 RepID=UPI000373C198|nr:sialidase family protein [Amycolatopsis nigrescens]
MRARRRWFAVFVLTLSAVLVAPGAPALADPPGTGQPGEYRPVRGPSAPAEHRFLQKTMPGQTLPRHAYAQAADQARTLPAIGGRWTPSGPANIGGRIVGLALDPQLPDTLYAAAASGGLWRSTDAGRTFAPAWPDDMTQAMGAVAAAPDGTLYVGTGEANPGGGSVTYEGTGLYRSTDRGRSWQYAGLRDSGAIGAILVDPADPRRITVAATGSLYSPGGDRGVYQSTDGGRSWRRSLDVANEFTGAVDVQADPADPRRMYAVLWDHRRTPAKRTYGGVGSGVFRSLDGGASWQRLADGLPAAGAEVGRIGIGVSATEPGRLYAIVNHTEGPFAGFYTSPDAGNSWTRLPEPPELKDSQASYGWWFGKVWVDPGDSRHLHVAGVPLVTSKDGGRTWTADAVSTHVDHHAMIWDPRHPSRVYLGNDGGVYRSDAGGDGGWVKAEHEPYTQFYSAAITPQDPSRISGGTQDNGSLRSWNGQRFNEYLGGDGEENLINPEDRDNVFACYQYGNCFRSTDGGDNLTFFTPQTTADRRNWFTPVQFDPTDPKTLYYGGNVLNRSTDGGVSWTPISPDLTGGPGQDAYPYGTITTVSAAPSDPRTIWVGTDDGRVWLTRDLGGSWTKVLDGQPWVTRIAVSERDAGTAYVTLSGYRSGSRQAHVLTTRDAGQRWTDLSGNLPDAPVNDVVTGPGGLLYVATDQGVFTGHGWAGGHWLRLGRGLPMVPVDDLEYDRGARRLVAATFGRGLYELRTP